MTIAVPPAIQLTAGLVMWILAPVILYLDHRSEANRAFSLFLVAQGGMLATFGAAHWGQAATTARFWLSLYPYFAVALPFTIGYFISVYPKRRSWVPDGIPAWAPFLAGAVVFELLVIGRPETFWAVDLLTPEMLQSVVYPGGIIFPSYRFVGMMFWVGEAALVAAAILLTRDVVRGEVGTPRIATALVGIGLFAPVSCQCSGGEFLNRTLYQGWNLLGAPVAQDPFVAGGLVLGVVHELLILVVVGLFLFELAYLAYHALTSDDDELRRILTPFVGLLVVSTGVLVLIFMPFVPVPTRMRVWISLYGFWWLVGTGLVAYAIARHSLFDLDVKVKWTMERGTVAAVFIAVFFVVSEAAQVLFAGFAGNELLGVLAAGGLVFLLAPLQRLASRLGDAAMPDTKEVSEMDAGEREDLFRQQAELVWMDGQLTEKDRKVLSNLRDQLGIDAETAETIEAEVLDG